ncbi:hypothetical protein [Salipiger sp. PrR003]|uniref:hypothetical protein n=1 Tax=Salipiger sp. PrR003 TaxID=2706776 RepID=UPI0013D92481|nr:hypothetical protein [Salipiger sp. PrR003]
MLKFVGLLCAGMIATGAYAQSCPEIRFAPGASSGVVSGNVVEDGVACFRFGAGAGQTATARIIAEPIGDLCLVVIGEVDCLQSEYTWKTQRGTQELRVGHMYRSVGTTPFKLELSIR